MAKVKVRYKGLSDVREISRKDLADRNISVPTDLVWHAGNNNTLLINMTEDLEMLLRNEGTFSITAVSDNETDGLEVVEASASAADESSHDDAVTVVDEENKPKQKSKKK